MCSKCTWALHLHCMPISQTIAAYILTVHTGLLPGMVTLFLWCCFYTFLRDVICCVKSSEDFVDFRNNAGRGPYLCETVFFILTNMKTTCRSRLLVDSDSSELCVIDSAQNRYFIHSKTSTYNIFHWHWCGFHGANDCYRFLTTRSVVHVITINVTTSRT